MNNKISTTFVYGNGLDLALHMKTSYKDFFEELNVQGGFFDQHSSNPLTDYIQMVGEKDNWFDFESIIDNFASQSNMGIALRRCELFLTLLDDGIKRKENAYNKLSEFQDIIEFIPAIKAIIDFTKEHKYFEFRGEQVKKMNDAAKREINDFITNNSELIKNGYRDLKCALANFLRPKIHRDFENSCAYRILGAILGLPNNGKDSLVDAFSKLSRNEKTLPMPNNNRIVSFNYVNEFERMGIHFQFNRKINRRLGLESYINSPLFMSIHGHLDFSNNSDYDDEKIIFGVNDDKDIPYCLAFLKKQYWQEENRRKIFNDLLFHSKRIVIYGHSIHGIDYEYYQDFLSEPHDDKEIYVIVNNQKAVDEIKIGLSRKGCNAFIKYLIVDIFETDEYLKLLEDIIRDTMDKSEGSE